MTELQAHPAAAFWPMMSEERYAELKADIAARGQRVPIVLCEGQILDGRNRYRACCELGLTPSFSEFTGNPYLEAISLNNKRRDLPDMVRALAGKRCRDASEDWQAQQRRIAEAGNRKRAEAAKEQPRDEGGAFQPVAVQKEPRPDSHPSRAAAAAADGVSTSTVAKAEWLDNKRPDLVDKVLAGEMKPTEALRQMKRDEIAKTVALPSSKYRVLYADPPWSYNDKADAGSVQSQGAEYHYPSMSIAELCALDVPSLCEPDAVLFLWVTSPLLFEAAAVVRAWGFSYRASFVWDKVKHNMGHYNSVRHELLLICVRGSCTPDHVALFDSVQVVERGAHSEKPEEFRQIIDTLYPHGKRLELFARRPAVGWDVWGNQAPVEAA